MSSNSILNWSIFFALSFFLGSCNRSTDEPKKYQMPPAFFDFLNTLTKENMLNERPAEAIVFLNHEFENYQSDSIVQHIIYSKIGNAFLNLHENDSTEFYLQLAHSFLQKHQQIAEYDYVQNLIYLTYFNSQKAKYNIALTYIKEAEEIINNSKFGNENKYIFLQGSMYSAYANVLSSFNEVGKSLAYNKKSINCFLRVPKINNISDRYFDLALDFEDLNEPDSAIYYTKIGISKIFSTKDSFAYCFANKILADFYNEKKMYDSTICFSKKAMQYLDSKSIENDKSLLINLSTAYFKKGDFVNLNIYYNAAKQAQLADTIATTTAANRVMQLLNIAVATNKIKDVDTLLKYYYKANEKNFEMGKAIAYQNMQVQYEVKAKNIKIEKLNIEKELIQTRLTNRNILLISLLIGLSLLIIIISQYYRNNSRKEEFNKLLLEQRLFRTQMNPHFIFNSMAVVHSLIEINENKKAANFLSHFSKLLRSVLTSSTQNFVTLENEIEILNEYLKLQKIRLDDQFNYEITLPEKMQPTSIFLPPMFLQPFVENAIEHGIRPSNQFGLIHISFVQNENFLECIIKDNGVGFETEKNDKISSTKLIAERLKILGKKQNAPAGISIVSNNKKGEDNGTIVTLKIPIEYD